MHIRFMKRIIILSILITLSLIFSQLSYSGDLKEGLISAYDAYVAPNKKSITLIAKLEKLGALNINSDVEGEALSFYVDGDLIGKATTDENGFAKVKYASTESKSRKFTAKLEDSGKYSAPKDTSLIYIVDPKKPTIICDIDWTVSKTDKSTLILRDSDTKSEPLKGSANTLDDLHDHYNIIFVTAREDALLHKTRAWLKKWHFPDFPVFYADIGQTSYFDQEDYKSETVTKIKKDIKGTTIGIGDKDHDAAAYLKSGLTTIIIRTKGDVPEGAMKASDWDEIKDELMKEEYRNIK